MQSRQMLHALAMIERFMREYQMDFDRAVDCAASFTGFTEESIKKAWHERKEEGK